MHSRLLLGTALAFAFGAAPSMMRAQTQPADNTASSAAGQTSNAELPGAAREASQMVPAQAELAQNLETSKVQPGEQFKAVLKGTVHLKNGAELPRGTTLIGTVADENAPQGDKSELAVRFTQADLKNGKTVPIAATIVGIAPPVTQDVPPASGLYNTPPNSWDGRSLVFDESEVIPGIDLHSRIAGTNSGVFVSPKKSNLKLGARTQLALAIGAKGAHEANGGY